MTDSTRVPGGDPYVPDFLDEALTPEGVARPHYAELLESLRGRDLDGIAKTAQEQVERAGITFMSGGERHPFRIDPIPRVTEASEWERLAAGLAQRARALEAFIGDVYAERAMVKAGRIPERVIEGADHLEPDMLGVDAKGGYALVAGFDLVRGADGGLRVLEDNLRTPSGFTYAIAARDAGDLALGGGPDRLQPDAAYPMLGTALAAARAEGGAETIVLLTEGESSPAFFEHRELADAIGIPLVTPEDVSVRAGRLVARLDGEPAREVGVVLRRADEDRLINDGESTWLADRLLEPIRRGTLSVVNGPGSGVGDDKLVHAYVEEMVRFYLGEEPLVRSVRTFDLEVDEQRAEVLERIDEMVVKPRGGEGGTGVIICRHADPEDRERAARLVAEHSGDWIAQETVDLSTHPTVCDDRLEPRHVDLRAFTIAAEAAPAPLTRYARGRGALVVNSSKGGGGKDTWILTG